jgi:hypothetical protein
MAKPKDRREARQLYTQIRETAVSPPTSPSAQPHDTPPSDAVLASSPELATLTILPQRRELPKMKKFRFQLLHQWMTARIEPCRVADVGGGKGLLAYLLGQSGWAATVIDPIPKPCPANTKT